MRRVSYKKLTEPPLRLRESKVISVEGRVNEAASTYVLEDNDSGRDQAWRLVENIIEIEKVSPGNNSLSNLPDFDSSEYRDRVQSKLMSAFDIQGNFHMQRDLETYLDSTSLPNSKFQRKAGVVFFELNYFAPYQQRVKGGIEKELGLEKKVCTAVQRVEYSRVGGGLYLKIPFEHYLKNRFNWLNEVEPHLAENVARSMRGEGYSLEFEIKGNTYRFGLGLPNIPPAWKKHLGVVNGALLGAAVAEEVYLSQRARRSDFEDWRKQEKADINNQIGQIEGGTSAYIDPDEVKMSLQQELSSLDCDQEFERFRGRRKDPLKHHLGKLREADRKYGVGNKIAMPWNGTTSHVYFENPVLERVVSLGRVTDYRAAKEVIKVYFPHIMKG